MRTKKVPVPKRKRKWPMMVAMVAALTLLLGAVSLVLVERFSPEQEYLPKSVVSAPSRFVSAIMRPLQKGFTWASDGIAQYLQSWKLRETLEIEYNKLKAANEELVFRALLVDELERQLAEIEDLRENLPSEIKTLSPVRATVIGKETGNWFQRFTIDVGEDHGVDLSMAVVNASGLIGEITKVEKTSSEVTTIIDSRSSVAAIISSTRDQGVVQGTLGIDDEPACRMYYLPVDLTPRPNDVVETSGIGVAFPKGLLIGTVRESTRHLDQNKHYFVIEPAVDFRHLETVMVLRFETEAESIQGGRDGQAAYVKQPMDTMRPVPTIMPDLNKDDLGGISLPSRPDRIGIDQPTKTESPHTDEEDEGMIEPGQTEYEVGNEGDPAPTNAPDAGNGPRRTANPDLDALLDDELESDLEGN